MTHPRRTFLDVAAILRQWVEDAEGTIRQSKQHQYYGNPVVREHVRELKMNLPKAKRALRELNKTL